MLRKIEHIKLALSAGAYEAALALALTLPDICAKVELGKTATVGEDYRNWADKHLDFSPLSSMGVTDEAEINGTLLYSLRCAFLHCGNDDIKNQIAAKNLPHTSFKAAPPNSLGISIIYSYRTKTNPKTVEAQIDIQAICELIYTAVERFYKSYTPQSDFDAYLL